MEGRLKKEGFWIFQQQYCLRGFLMNRRMAYSQAALFPVLLACCFDPGQPVDEEPEIRSLTVRPSTNAVQVEWNASCGAIDSPARYPSQVLLSITNERSEIVSEDVLADFETNPAQTIVVDGLDNGDEYLAQARAIYDGEPALLVRQSYFRPDTPPDIAVVREQASNPFFTSVEAVMVFQDLVTGSVAALDTADATETILGDAAQSLISVAGSEVLLMKPVDSDGGSVVEYEIVDIETGRIIADGRIEDDSMVLPFRLDDLQLDYVREDDSQWYWRRLNLSTLDDEPVRELAAFRGSCQLQAYRQCAPSLSADGELIAYTVSEDERQIQSSTVRIESSMTGEVIGRFAHPNPVVLAGYLTWNLEGTAVAVSVSPTDCRTDWSELWILRPESGRWLQATGFLDQEAVPIQTGIAWSRDGRAIAISGAGQVQIVSLSPEMAD